MKRFAAEGYLLESFRFGEDCLKLARKGVDSYVIKDNFLIENLFASMREIFVRNI